MTRTIYRGPKRRIEKVSCVIDHALANGENHTVLHTCEDSQTLIRIVGNVRVVLDGAQVCHLTIQRAPNGNPTYSGSVAESLDQPRGKEFIASDYLAGDVALSPSSNYKDFSFDIKGMRMLTEADTLLFTDKSGAIGGKVSGHFTLFFKE